MISHCVIHHWLIDISSSSLIHQLTGERRRLGEYQLKLLIVLVQNAGKIFTREELNSLVWERRVIGNNSLPNAIHALRVALEDNGKQQRIIKTIPKKGYILETEFCQFHLDKQEKNEGEEPTAEESRENKSPLSLHTAVSPDNHPGQHAPQQVIPHRTQKRDGKREHFWRWMSLAQGLLLSLVVGLLAITSSSRQENKMVEQSSGIYSHIHLYTLAHSNDPLSLTEDINKLLAPALTELNTLLRVKQAEMKVFYLVTASALNYTIVITNRCDRRQLAMKIAQFRSDNSQLNALIYRETERKINEMENCIN
ncbi:transcriptional regulator [Erwinia endophytica]|uniref:winged helix-turn-helix domain-containing protein n=1 Tax=Erwinia endophytica TaxID=1563158 RepID=UPI001265EFDB|nr:transcriptional regulator [Erwinia endophytica]KAB8312466.1 transcriptional regulator [Erwinia endophytica]